jgi:hypothetical protein
MDDSRWRPRITARPTARHGGKSDGDAFTEADWANEGDPENWSVETSAVKPFPFRPLSFTRDSL